MVLMYVCQYCSQENSTKGPCQRCGVEGNPSGTPWGIRERRDTKYWHKYNWDNRVFVGKEEKSGRQGFNAQEQANFDNFNEIKKIIRPGKISSAKHLTVKEPLAGGYLHAIQEVRDMAEEADIPVEPENIGEIEQLVQDEGREDLLPAVVELEQELVEEENRELEEPTSEEKTTPMGDLPYKMIHPPGQRFPIHFHKTGKNKHPRGIVLVELPNGMRFPFYSSSGTYGKENLGIYAGTWSVLFGLSHTWYNKGPWPYRYGLSGYKLLDIRHLDDPQLIEIQQWLNKKWTPERIMKQKTKQ